MAANISNVLISELYKSRTTIIELMEKNGYNVKEYANFSVNELNTMRQNNQLDMLLEKTDVEPEFSLKDVNPDRKRKMYIHFYLGKSLRPANVQEIVDDLFHLEEILSKSDTLYIIIKDEANETLMNEIKQTWEKDEIFIVLESIKRLQYNILNHTLVPNHRILSHLEIAQVMDKYNITDKSLFPEISRFDPVARAIGIRPGDICHIIRPSKTAIEANYYRVCV